MSKIIDFALREIPDFRVGNHLFSFLTLKFKIAVNKLLISGNSPPPGFRRLERNSLSWEEIFDFKIKINDLIIEINDFHKKIIDFDDKIIDFHQCFARNL